MKRFLLPFFDGSHVEMESTKIFPGVVTTSHPFFQGKQHESCLFRPAFIAVDEWTAAGEEEEEDCTLAFLGVKIILLLLFSLLFLTSFTPKYLPR